MSVVSSRRCPDDTKHGDCSPCRGARPREDVMTDMRRSSGCAGRGKPGSARRGAAGSASGREARPARGLSARLDRRRPRHHAGRNAGELPEERGVKAAIGTLWKFLDRRGLTIKKRPRSRRVWSPRIRRPISRAHRMAGAKRRHHCRVTRRDEFREGLNPSYACSAQSAGVTRLTRISFAT